MASYPTSVKTFSTKATGNTITAAFFNEPQDEITAMENALLSTGFAHHLIFAADSTYDIGTTSVRPRVIYADDVNAGATVLAATAFIVNAATTAGIRLDLNSGTLEVREGDDSAYGPMRAGSATFADVTVNGVTVINSAGAVPETAIADGTLLARVASTETISALWTFTTRPIATAGTSADEYMPAGTLYSTTTAVGNVGAGEDDLISTTIAANVLSTIGQSLHIHEAGTFAANGDTKRLKWYWNGVAILDSGASAFNNVSYVLDVVVTLVSGGNQNLQGSLVIHGVSPIVTYTTGTATMTGAVVTKTTGEGVSNNDIIAKQRIVRWFPHGPQ